MKLLEEAFEFQGRDVVRNVDLEIELHVPKLPRAGRIGQTSCCDFDFDLQIL
jgi:hypothetical protein